MNRSEEMALINCPECGKQVSDVASSCPNCGYPISHYIETMQESNNANTFFQENKSEKKDIAVSVSTEEARKHLPKDAKTMALVKCSQCGKEYSSFAEICPHCGYSEKNKRYQRELMQERTNQYNPNNKNNGSTNYEQVKYFLIGLLFIVAVIFIFKSCVGGSNKKPSETSLKTQAWVCAQDIVKQNLKSPSTAKFCTMPEATIRNSKNNDWSVSGWVDAQNSFGGTIRTKFLVTLTLTENGYKNGYVIFDE